MNDCVTCRVADGGRPKCKLGEFQPPAGPRNVEIKGHSLHCIIQSRKRGERYCRGDCYQRTYDIALLASNPNFEDDKAGVPFAGETGDVLLEFLWNAKFDPDRTFVTYVAKCKPPKGRKPSLEEISTCQTAYLFDELNLAKPKVVMTLGAIPLRLFNLHQEGGVTTIHGQVFERELPDGTPVKVVPTVDPATFLFRQNAQFQRRCQEDYKVAMRSTVHGAAVLEPFRKTPYTLVKTEADVDWLVSLLEAQPVFAFDTESCGFPWTKERILNLSFSWGTTAAENWIVPINHQDPEKYKEWQELTEITKDPEARALLKTSRVTKCYWATLGPQIQQLNTLAQLMEDAEGRRIFSKFKGVFENPKIAKVAHNLKYDACVLYAWGGIHLKGFNWDTMLMHHVLDESYPHDLKSLADIEFQVGPYSDPIRAITGKGDNLIASYDKVPDEVLWQYGATDSECCWRLFLIYLERLRQQPHLMKLYIEETEPASREFTKAEIGGAWVYKDRLESVKQNYTDDQDALLIDLRSQTNPEFNPSSNDQVRKALKREGFAKEIMDEFKACGYNVSKERLLEIDKKSKIATKVVTYRNNRKMISTYLDRMIEDLDYDGNIRYQWKLHGTETGRTSCTLLQQVPRFDKQIAAKGRWNMRDIFGVEENFWYVYMDYSQIELRILAIIADDKEMQRLFREGANIHAETAATVLQIPIDQVSDFNRQLGKKINFGLAYGSEGHRLAKTAEWEDANGNRRFITLPEVQSFMGRFRERFVGVSNYIEELPTTVRGNGGILRTVFGRERRFGSLLNAADEQRRRHAERAALNASIQSPAGGITLRTIIELGRILDDFGTKYPELPTALRMLNTVHDSIAFATRDDLVEWFVPLMRHVAQRPIPELGGASFPIDFGIGKSWADAENNKIKWEDWERGERLFRAKAA
jgi:uracil-DNA glycosylase family 4